MRPPFSIIRIFMISKYLQTLWFFLLRLLFFFLFFFSFIKETFIRLWFYRRKLTRHDQHVSVLFSVIGSVASGAVPDRKTRRLLTNLLIFPLIFIHLSYWVFYTFLLETLRQFRDRKPRRTAHHELLQRIVHEFILFLHNNEIVKRLYNLYHDGWIFCSIFLIFLAIWNF